MPYNRRGPCFVLALLCTFTLLLAACRTSTSTGDNTAQNAARLSLQVTPTFSTTTPGSSTPGTTTPEQYVGQISNQNAWIGISTTSKRMVAFVTDGSKGHSPTFAQWFRGPINNGVLDASAPAKSGSDRLQGTVNKNTATGTVTLAGGKSLAFTANAVPAGDTTGGLYRSEHTVNNQRYVAGWVVQPTQGALGTATPAASASAGVRPPLIGSVTPTTTQSTTPSATGTASPSASATGTASPSASATGSPSTTGMLQQGSALLNEQNHTVQPLPPLTQAQISSHQVSIPNMGNFNIVPCQQNLC